MAPWRIRLFHTYESVKRRIRIDMRSPAGASLAPIRQARDRGMHAFVALSTYLLSCA